jgi:hypothetical protein
MNMGSRVGQETYFTFGGDCRLSLYQDDRKPSEKIVWRVENVGSLRPDAKSIKGMFSEEIIFRQFKAESGTNHLDVAQRTKIRRKSKRVAIIFFLIKSNFKY